MFWQPILERKAAQKSSSEVWPECRHRFAADDFRCLQETGFVEAAAAQVMNVAADLKDEFCFPIFFSFYDPQTNTAAKVFRGTGSIFCPILELQFERCMINFQLLLLLL